MQSKKYLEHQIPEKNYIQICFPGQVHANSGEKIISMIGGRDTMRKAVHECAKGEPATLRMKVGPLKNGPSIHGTVHPATTIWLRLTTKKQRKQNGSHSDGDERYVSDAQICGLVKASAIFSNPADLCYLPVSEELDFDPNAAFDDVNLYDERRLFQPHLKTSKREGDALHHLSNPIETVKLSTNQSTTSGTNNAELYVPPALFLSETCEAAVPWFTHMLPRGYNDDPSMHKSQLNIYLKMRFYELNLSTNTAYVRPLNDGPAAETKRDVLPQSFLLSYESTLQKPSLLSKRPMNDAHFRIQVLSLCTLKPFTAAYVPQYSPGQAFVDSQAHRLREWVQLLHRYFENRPIWTMHSLNVATNQNKETYTIIKHVIGCVAYRVVGVGAFNKVWIRYGFDPFSLRRNRDGAQCLKHVALITPIVFVLSKPMRREIRRRFPSFGPQQKNVPTGYRRPLKSDFVEIQQIILSKNKDRKNSKQRTPDQILREESIDTNRCKVSLEEFFDNLMLERRFVASFVPEGIECERVHSVIRSQVAAEANSKDGLISDATRRTVRSILEDEFVAYFRSKFPLPTADTEEHVENEPPSSSSDTVDSSASIDDELRSNDSCFELSADDYDDPCAEDDS